MIAHQIKDFEAPRKQLRASFDSAIRILTGIRELAQASAKNGYPTRYRSHLEEALERVRRLESEVFTHWIQPELTSAEEARASDLAGECRDVEEVMAELAGIPLEVFRARVELRRRQLAAGGPAGAAG
jgi:hypothetical protein